MNELDIRYALAKQLGSAYAVHSDYGVIWLDGDMRKAVAKALKRLLEKRLKTAEARQ